MRCAPPVTMACGRDARWASVVTCLAALAAGTLAWWLVRRLGASSAAGAVAALAAGLLVALFVARDLRRGARRRLQWDGRSWLLDDVAGRVDVMIDLGGWMLLRFEGPSPGPAARAARSRWLPISLGRGGSAPHLCRAALHAEAGRSTGPGA